MQVSSSYLLVLFSFLSLKNLLWLASGHYIPQLSQAIVEHNQASGENTINLMGYMVSLPVLIINPSVASSHECLFTGR